MWRSKWTLVTAIVLLLGAAACSERAAVGDAAGNIQDGPIGLPDDGVVDAAPDESTPQLDVPSPLQDGPAALDASDGGTPGDALPNPDIGGTPCTNPTPCNGYACNTDLNICRTACYSNSHCAATYQCGANNTCVKQTGCTDDTPCQPYSCDLATGRCNTSCTNSGSCASGKACDPRNGTCVNETKCTDSAPCNGYACDTQAGQCRLLCLGNQHCANGYTCVV